MLSEQENLGQLKQITRCVGSCNVKISNGKVGPIAVKINKNIRNKQHEIKKEFETIVLKRNTVAYKQQNMINNLII